MRLSLNPDFDKLWVAQAVSSFGSKITREALAYTAVLTLAATPAQMSILSVAGAVPVLLLSLFVGVWVDRLPRRPTMIVADLARAVALSAVPLAALTNNLQRMAALCGRRDYGDLLSCVRRCRSLLPAEHCAA